MVHSQLQQSVLCTWVLCVFKTAERVVVTLEHFRSNQSVETSCLESPRHPVYFSNAEDSWCNDNYVIMAAPAAEIRDPIYKHCTLTWSWPLPRPRRHFLLEPFAQHSDMTVPQTSNVEKESTHLVTEHWFSQGISHLLDCVQTISIQMILDEQFLFLFLYCVHPTPILVCSALLELV